MPVYPRLFDMIRFHAASGLGWEDVMVKLKLISSDAHMVRRIVLETAPGHRGAKAGPADGLPSLPAGPDIRRKT